MALLNLSDLDSARKALVKVKNSTKGDAETKKGYIEESERAACDTLGIPKFTNHQVVEYVSNLRQTLGADPITKLNSNEVVREIHQQEKKSEQKINIDIFRKDLDNLQSCLSEENRKLLKEADENLCRLIHDIRTDEKLTRELSLEKLLELGVTLIGNDGSCPLCLAPWRPGELKETIRSRIAQAVLQRSFVSRSRRMHRASESKSRSVLRELTPSQEC